MNDKKKNIYLHMVLPLIASIFVLLAFRFVYAAYLNEYMYGIALRKTLLITLLSTFTGFTVCYGIRKENIKAAGMLLSVVSYVILLLTVLLSLNPQWLSGQVWYYLVNYIYHFDYFVPALGVIPLGVTLYLKRSEIKKRNTNAIIILSSFAILSSFVAGALTGVYILLLVSVILFGLLMKKDGKMSISLIVAPAIIFLISTAISYKLSGCSNIENFIIYQYEPESMYVEGPWDSLQIFDGSMMRSIQSAGLFSGAKVPVLQRLTAEEYQDFLYVWSGTYCAPVNILLAYGWIPFLVMLASSITLIASGYRIAMAMKSESLKWGGMIISSLLTVTTVTAYLCFPRMTTPLGPIYTSKPDLGIVIIMLLLWFMFQDYKMEKNREKDMSGNMDDVDSEDIRKE